MRALVALLGCGLLLLIPVAMFAPTSATAQDDLCDVRFRPRPPLLDTPKHDRAYRVGRPYNDRGTA